MGDKPKAFRIFYNPSPFPVSGQHLLDEKEDYHEAIQSALDSAKIWGPTWVTYGRKKIFEYGKL